VGEDERQIRELVDKWMAATGARDVPAVLDLMTDDVLFLTPGREPFGKDEFRHASEGMRNANIHGRASVQEIQVVGDWAWLRNHIDLTIAVREGSSVQRSGHTLTIFRKGQDERWRVYRDANLVS
jgi:uncharacterized protein (TIGR02246 family)